MSEVYKDFTLVYMFMCFLNLLQLDQWKNIENVLVKMNKVKPCPVIKIYEKAR